MTFVLFLVKWPVESSKLQSWWALQCQSLGCWKCECLICLWQWENARVCHKDRVTCFAVTCFTMVRRPNHENEWFLNLWQHRTKISFLQHANDLEFQYCLQTRIFIVCQTCKQIWCSVPQALLWMWTTATQTKSQPVKTAWGGEEWVVPQPRLWYVLLSQNRLFCPGHLCSINRFGVVSWILIEGANPPRGS